METERTEAIVLRAGDFGESDRLVTFYTRGCGRLRGIAKRARKSTRRFANALEPGSLVELDYRLRRSLAWIETCRLREAHCGLREDIHRFIFGALVCETLSEMTPEGDPDGETFDLALETLGRLARGREPENDLVLFFARFLGRSGFLPAFDLCARCGAKPAPGSGWAWDPATGLLTCRGHAVSARGVLHLDLGAGALLRQALRLPLGALWRLRVGRERRGPLLSGLLSIAREQTRREFRSLRLLRQLSGAARTGRETFGELDSTV